MARRDITGAVDFGYLERYAAGDMDLVEEVLGLFRHQAELWAPMLDPSGGAEGWRDAAHTLRGSASSVGAFALAEACAAAEAEADLSARPRHAELVRTALDAAEHDIAAYLHERALQGLKTPRVLRSPCGG